MVSQLGRWRLGSLVRRDDAGEVRTCTDGGIGNRSERLLRFHADRSRDINAAQERGARHAALLQRFSGGGTPRLVDCRLDTDLPYLVVQQPRGISLHQWLQQSAAMQPSTLLTRVRVARQVAEVLQSAHRLGYVHGRLNTATIWVDTDSNATLLGWACCVPVGHALVRADGSRVEASSAVDARLMGDLLCQLLGQGFVDSALGLALRHEQPERRPTMGELIPMVDWLEQHLESARAA